MESHKCKLCLRNFANGKALGGHMRSHVMNLCRQSRADEEISEETGSIPPSSSEEDEEKQKEREIFFAATPSGGRRGGGGGDDSVVLQDRESETELSKNQLRSTPRCRRSKRIKKSRISNIHNMREELEVTVQKGGRKATESSPVSSISDTSPEEDVAYCLMLLSKDKWMKGEEEYQNIENDDENSDEAKVAVKKAMARGKYRCESCSKVFRSYQALGGHRASHKKTKPNNLEVVGNRNSENAGEIDGNIHHQEKIHECPVCYRVFSSGQALGGHKRSHFTASAAASVSLLDCSASTSTAINVEKQGLSRTGGNSIDLNLPAPVDDDDTISQIELSAISDACFLRPH